jgi:hypothetical protein
MTTSKKEANGDTDYPAYLPIIQGGIDASILEICVGDVRQSATMENY